jgi:hypothetical protein
MAPAPTSTKGAIPVPNEDAVGRRNCSPPSYSNTLLSAMLTPPMIGSPTRTLLSV